MACTETVAFYRMVINAQKCNIAQYESLNFHQKTVLRVLQITVMVPFIIVSTLKIRNCTITLWAY